jgi:hypothetical protein
VTPSAGWSMEGSLSCAKSELLSGIVKDDSQRKAFARAQGADSVAHRYTIDAASASLGAVIDGKKYHLALMKRNDLDAGLHPWALFGKDKLASGEVNRGSAEKKCSLYGEDEIAVEILVETVEVAGIVLQQQRCGTGLSRAVALGEELLVIGRIVDRVVEIAAPLGCDASQRWIEVVAQGLDDLGEWVIIVLVFSASEAVFGHDDSTTKLGAAVVAGGELVALRWREERASGSVASFAEAGGDACPVEGSDLFLERDVLRCHASTLSGKR